MKLIIFSDLDGTFLNNNTYSFGSLKDYINSFRFDFELIFVSSKTFAEISRIQKDLNLNFPVIAENGACIIFPKDYLRQKIINKSFFKYGDYFFLSLTALNSDKIVEKFSLLKKKYMFSFFSELSEDKLKHVTNLDSESLKLSKLRNFTNPIYWQDTQENKKIFKNDISNINSSFSILEGGRFMHVSDNYDKGVALKKFLEIKNNHEKSYTTISLGDSENDLPMLEQTDFSCIIKSRSKIYLKKKKNIIYKSKMVAPNGWKESLNFILNKGIKNF